MATQSNLLVEQGTTFSADITIENEDIDLVDYNVYGQIRKSYKSTSKIDFNTQIVDASNFTISLTPAQTENIDFGKYVYDVEIHRIADGVVYRVIEGSVEVTPGVTRIES
jgi:hypothetical protein